jgi:hypothetical protein
MIRLNHSHHQIRIDTTIKIIEKDGTEVTAPVIVIVDLKKIEEKQQYNIFKLANGLFNKPFTLNRIPTPIKKAWWRVW